MYRFVTAVSVLLLASPILAGDFDSGSNETDGALDCAALFALNPDCGVACDQTCTVQIDLALAASLCDCDIDPKTPDVPCQSICPSPVPGRGVYDASEWAVVFNYTTINIPAEVTVTFLNHPKGAPVMWLATEDVTIAGQVRLDGADGCIDEGCSYAAPGPGGFSGGVAPLGGLGGSAGFGPGGGASNDGGGYGTRGGPSGNGGLIYGTASIVPLIGGSGGSFWTTATPGGAGGGAMLIASSTNIFLDSTGGIFANGGNAYDPGLATSAGSGSGGGIRLIANNISGSGVLRATGGTVGNDGGDGRIRVEATTYDLDDLGDPRFPIITVPGFVFPVPETPSLRATIVNNTSVPTDPEATVRSADVVFTAEGPVTIEIEARNIPIGSIVQVRIARAFDSIFTLLLDSTPLVGTFELSTATVENVTFINGASEVQLSVVVE